MIGRWRVHVGYTVNAISSVNTVLLEDGLDLEITFYGIYSDKQVVFVPSIKIKFVINQIPTQKPRLHV